MSYLAKSSTNIVAIPFCTISIAIYESFSTIIYITSYMSSLRSFYFELAFTEDFT